MRAKTPVRKAKPNASLKASPAAKRTRAKPPRNKSLHTKASHTTSSRDKVHAYRQRMRANGRRLVQMWLPDVRTPEFAAEARRQSLLANHSSFAGEDQAWVDSICDRKFD